MRAGNFLNLKRLGSEGWDMQEIVKEILQRFPVVWEIVHDGMRSLELGERWGKASGPKLKRAGRSVR